MRIVHSLGDLKKDLLGRPYQMFGTAQDITERKSAEKALQQSQFYLTEGQRLAHMGSWAFNDSGHYEKGVFKGFVGTTIDVTEQELLTQELRREKAYLAEGKA
jgi:hypothetical protein